MRDQDQENGREEGLFPKAPDLKGPAEVVMREIKQVVHEAYFAGFGTGLFLGFALALAFVVWRDRR